MNVALPNPISIDEQTVTLSRTEWDAYIAEVEDLSDRLATARHEALIVERGRTAIERESFTNEEMTRLLEGISAITIFRERFGLTRRALARTAGISPSYLTEIEHRKKPGSVAALSKLAEALGVPMDALTV